MERISMGDIISNQILRYLDTPAKRYLGFAGLIAIIIAFFGLIIHVAPLGTSQISNNDYLINNGICGTLSCVLAASNISKRMDSRLHPCDNFYYFACGQFIEKNFVPEDRNTISAFGDVEILMDKQLNHLITDVIKDDRPVFKSMKNYHQACMDIDQVEKNSEKELLEVLKELGGCPLLDGTSWDESRLDLNYAPIIYKSIKKNLVQMYISVDPNNSNKHIIKIDGARQELDYLDLIEGMDNDDVKNHLLALIEMFGFLGVNKKNAKKELGDVMDLQIKLAKISLSYNDRHNSSKLNNRMTLEELSNNYPVINWNEFIDDILGSYVEFNSSAEIILVDPHYFKSLHELITRFPLRVLANYACVRQIWELTDNMSERFLRTKLKAVADYSPKKEEPRWIFCLQKLSKHFAPVVGWLYVKNYFDKSTKEKVVELVNYVHDALVTLIESADWMDDLSRLRTMEKASRIKSHIAFPNEFNDDEKVYEVYQYLPILNSSFLRSELTLNEFHQKSVYFYLGKTVNETIWIQHSDTATVNAKYFLETNTYDLPAAMLQGEFYSSDRPNYLNFAAIGIIVGHEMSHAFDDRGSQYDETGNIAELFKNETRMTFLNKTSCIVEQYDNIYINELNDTLKGSSITQGENIADNIGLKAAYLAYTQWVKNNGKEPRLPNLDFTPEQMFWLSYANILCIKYKPGFLSKLPEIYIPHEARVVGPLSNLQAFSHAFNCSVGSPMNPANKCSVF